jgi:two-component system phosphate regulon sensor histidine kinase PhoR
LPLQVDNRNVGFLFFSSRQKESFTTHHACLLRALLDEMSALIEKAWMIDQLSKARKDYLTMLGFVAHELKAPLATMTTMGHMYLDGYFGPQDKAGIDTISKMLKISGYMINMIQNYLGLSQLETGEMRFKPQEGVKFREDVLDFVINTLDARIRERNAQIKIEGTYEISLEADPDLLRIVFTNLVDNAVKYGEENGVINIHYQTDNQKLTFKIRNTGVGFTPEQASQLFKRFNRLHQKGLEDRKGTGLGLYLTWWIIQKHRGHISATSEPGKWAEFYVELPLTQTQSIN